MLSIVSEAPYFAIRPKELLGATAHEVRLAFPVGVAIDRFDNLFIADLGNSRILRVFRLSGLR